MENVILKVLSTNFEKYTSLIRSRWVELRVIDSYKFLNEIVFDIVYR